MRRHGGPGRNLKKRSFSIPGTWQNSRPRLTVSESHSTPMASHGPRTQFWCAWSQGRSHYVSTVGAPGSLRESVQTAYQNLLARNKELIGDRDAREHELNVQVRAMDVSRSGTLLGVPVLLAFCSALLMKSLRGGLVVVGGLSVGGSFEPVHNAVSIAELAVEKGAQTVLFPVSARRQLNDLSDDMAAKITVVYYVDVRDALLKALVD